MTTWKGQTRGGVAGYRFFIFILKYLGIRFTYFFLNFVVLYFVLFSAKSRKPIYFYFNTILGYKKLKSLRYVFKNNYKLGQVLIDKVALLAGYSDHFTFDFEGEEYIREMAANEGGLLIGAHVGNWEIAGQLLERIDTKVHILMLEAEHEKIKGLLDNVMTKKSMHIIPIKDDFSYLLLIKEALQKNEIVAMHGDRFLKGSKTMLKNFLGRQAKFPEGPFYLSVKYKKPVIFVSAVKETNSHYHFFATKPYYDKNEGLTKEERISNLLDLYINALEKTLKHYPEQWFNYYYFWEQTDQ
jgi:predicted LPLAT superfamily acyltransferase